MSKWTELVQKDLAGKFGNDVSFGATRPLPGVDAAELSVTVAPARIVDVMKFLKAHPKSAFMYLETLTAIDYPKQFLPPPPDTEPFRAKSTLEKKEGAKANWEHGRSAPLDPPRLTPGESTAPKMDINELKQFWPEHVMIPPLMEKPKMASPTAAPTATPSTAKPIEQKPSENSDKKTETSKEPADTKKPISSTKEAKMVAPSEKSKKSEKLLTGTPTHAALPAPKPTASLPAPKPSAATSTTASSPKAATAAPAPSTPPKPITNNQSPPPSPKYDRNQIAVVYVLFSHETNTRLVVRCDLDRERPEIDSVTSVWKAADWNEREVFDLYGVTFRNHPNLKRLFMDYPQFPGGHPLRKDYERPGFMVRLPKVL